MAPKPSTTVETITINARFDDLPGECSLDPIACIKKRLMRVTRLLKHIDPPTWKGSFLLIAANSKPIRWFRLLTAKKCIIGRNQSLTDLTLYDPVISNVHCMVLKDRLCWKIVDLNSRNGLRVNDSPVIEKYLCDGDIIQLIGMELVFVDYDNC